MDRHEDDDDEWEQQNVEHVPTKKGVGTNFHPGKEHEFRLGSKHRGVPDHVGTHRYGPQGQLVPRKKVAREGEQQEGR